MMAVQAGTGPGPEDCTVVVLGCQVSASGEPTVMLRDRIDAAYDYLTAHPESRCVASGRAERQRAHLRGGLHPQHPGGRGIDPDRILLEDRSRSTEENLRFTAEIIRQQGLNPRVAIASDNFHQLRASVWARRCGPGGGVPGLRQLVAPGSGLLGPGGRGRGGAGGWESAVGDAPLGRTKSRPPQPGWVTRELLLRQGGRHVRRFLAFLRQQGICHDIKSKTASHKPNEIPKTLPMIIVIETAFFRLDFFGFLCYIST